jgi:SAM-dependent methyltransferase
MSESKPSTLYTNSFYTSLEQGARSSAEVVVPLILKLTSAQSVVDIGCGSGVWLNVFKKFGVEDILGADGLHVPQEILAIPTERFVRFDLSQPFSFSRSFDLVVSLEVAEHLPEKSAATFVTSLTQLGPMILFSAAIPFQGGTNHVNEQWPEYWSDLFEKSDYMPVDCLRDRLWREEAVDWWYAQNMLVFIQRNYIDSRPSLKSELREGFGKPLARVHPKRYLQFIEWCNATHYER